MENPKTMDKSENNGVKLCGGKTNSSVIICDKAIKPKPAIQWRIPLYSLLDKYWINKIHKFKIFIKHNTNFSVAISICIFKFFVSSILNYFILY